VAAGIGCPVRVGGVVLFGSLHQDVLDVAPSQIRVRVQHQGNDPGNQRRGGRSAAEIVGIVACRVTVGAHQVGCRDAHGAGGIRIGGNQDRSPGLAVIRLPSVMIDRRYGDRVAGIGIAVVVGIVVVLKTVARRPHVDVAKTAAPCGDAVLQSGQRQRSRTRKRADIRRSPAVIVDVNLLHLVCQGAGFVSIRAGAGNQTQPRQGSVSPRARHADPVVRRSRRDPGHRGPVKIPCWIGRRIGVVEVKVVAQRRLVLRREVGMRVLKTVVDDSDHDA